MKKLLKCSTIFVKVCLGLLSGMLLSGCISNVWTAASAVYDRHTLYRKGSDFQLNADINRSLYHDKLFKREDISLDVTVFNGDVLLVGHVPSAELRQAIESRVVTIGGYRRLFNQIHVSSGSFNHVKDTWITTKIRSEMLADSDIDPKTFKIITADQVVYLMGDVVPSQANRVINIARQCVGVRRVVKLLKYYNLSDRPAV